MPSAKKGLCREADGADSRGTVPEPVVEEAESIYDHRSPSELIDTELPNAGPEFLEKAATGADSPSAPPPARGPARGRRRCCFVHSCVRV